MPKVNRFGWWLCALAGAVGLVLAGPAAAKPPVWTVHDADSTIVIFGSVHLLPQGLDWPPPELIEALKSADDVWFELPIDDAAAEASSRLSQERGMLPAADRLSAHLTPDQWRRVVKEAERLQIPPTALDRMRPWLAEITLSVVADGRAGATISDGVEQTLQALAPATARRHAFETPAEQIGFLAGAPEADQIASLDQTLGELETEPDLYEKVVAEWMAGDLPAIQKRALDPLKAASPVMYDRLITARNARWAKVLTRRMQGSGRTVVVVGVGHLAGPGGLPALLRARGFDVDGP
jgi:uncharacterized protein YbaP (TraB family)